ncbi:hypothetical protein [Enterococcus sp. ZJ1668]|uniref:hypothetical protein n=1 Tax=Enterococcus sp. ZJ1668 TaxID=2709402 RepID=UPI0013EB8AD2|nr:hypothetical protein [Enterococcus sp. ZJ1668]
MTKRSILSSAIFVIGLFCAGIGDGDFSLENFFVTSGLILMFFRHRIADFLLNCGKAKRDT